MRAVDIIIKKRDGHELTTAEIEFFVHGFTHGEIPDYQAAAWAMAIFLRGMTPRETADLTLAMAHSGQVLDLSGIVETAVDKHSSGGVGDKTSLVVLPWVAACGLPVGKMSGRGLGFSGGTLDKLESIPGYRVDLSTQEFLDQLRRIGLVLSGQSLDLAPADGKLYALRDVTGTVDSIPLIASSIMSKKIAAGAQAIVLDVKCGNGAFMETLERARALARLMVAIGKQVGRRTIAVISDMNQPLGYAVGNALEVREAIQTLHGTGPRDFYQHCQHIAAQMLMLGRKASSLEEAALLLDQALHSGAAWEMFRKLVQAQGGEVRYVDEPELLPRARWVEAVPAPRSGYLAAIHARTIGETAVLLGAGRARKGDPIDHAVGFLIPHKVGDWVERGAPLFEIHANQPEHLELARSRLLNAFAWSDTPVEPLPLFYGIEDESTLEQ
uniref:Pyrimidine nucleoside phosphorylase n=1 Tax=uncultured Chloroflexota bacterium TaxID=166587 RepID=H5SAM0_9CHLR|nr:pyrimidine nucleoside phosphorylase [uncultured Chloroflexota bacterium]